MVNKVSDNEIIRRVLDGEKDMFRGLVEQYQPMVFRICMGFLHNKDDAEDLTQEVFIQAYLSLSGFKGNSSFATWIYRIAVNVSLNKMRSTSRNLFLRRLDSLLGTQKKGNEIQLFLPDNEDPESLLIGSEHRKWVQQALNSLPDKQRTAIILSKYDDMSQVEIAQIMNTTEGAVESLLQRAKVNLREKLSASRKKNIELP
jgi:RNA polymerase sigma-70 factor, ECF subfamily